MSEPESNELKPPAGGTPHDAPPAEDASTQALSEALRSSFLIVRILMVILAVVFLFSGFFIVDAQHKAIILRLGRPVGKGPEMLLGPGIHFAFPPPIDEVRKIPFTSLQRADSSVGWYLTPAQRARGEPTPPPQGTLNPSTTSYDLTADTNIIQLAATLNYRITDPIKFHFDFADAERFVTNALDNALLSTASRFTVDAILTTDQTAFKEAVEARLRDLVEQQGLGISVEGVYYQSSPPLALVPDFNRVNQAGSDSANIKNLADSHRSTVLGAARGEKDARVNIALTEKAGMIALLRAEETNFDRLLPDYQKNPDLVTRLLLTETFERVWTNAEFKQLIPDLEGNQLRIHLNNPIKPLFTSTNGAP